MLTDLKFNNFTAVPHLAGTQLFQNHKGEFNLSLSKPNVIVGPNGAGKSALVKALALRFMAFYSGFSAFDDHYTEVGDGKALWKKVNEFGTGRRYGEWVFMEGLACTTDNAPALYYSAGMLPGDDHDYTTAMVCGYFDLAKNRAELVKHTSSGQNCRLLLGDMSSNPHAKVESGDASGKATGKSTVKKRNAEVEASSPGSIIQALRGEALPSSYGFQNWRCGRTRRDKKEVDNYHQMPWDQQSDVLKELFLDVEGGKPLILMDEPEQSLDARAESRLWAAIRDADCTKVQVVVASHSLYPILHPEHFNIIEAVPGYVNEVRALL